MLIAERFGQLPWTIEDAPADRALYYLDVLRAEAEAKRELEGVPVGESVIEIE